MGVDDEEGKEVDEKKVEENKVHRKREIVLRKIRKQSG